MKKYDMWEYHTGRLKLDALDKELMEILTDFGESIDSQGYAGGDYDRAFKRLHRIFKIIKIR